SLGRAWPLSGRRCRPRARPFRGRRPADAAALDRRRQPAHLGRQPADQAHARRQESRRRPAHVHPGAGHRQGVRDPRGRRNGGAPPARQSRRGLTATGLRMHGDIEFHLPLHLAIPLVLLCLALGAYMSAAETAITGASRARMHRLAQQGKRRAATVNKLLDRKDEAVSAVLLGNSVMNILSASLTTVVLTDLFGAAGVVYATVIIGIMVVIFAEVMPKTWALLRADRVALILAPSIVVTLGILGPVARAVAWISRLFLRLIGVRSDPSIAAQEHDELLRGAIELHGVGHIDEDAPTEKAMLRSVLDLGDRTVGDVMTHRGSLVLIDADEPADAIVTQMLAAPYTRVPLYRGQHENIVGVVHAKDL